MVILSRAEKEKLVLDLYSQGKTYKQIAQEIRISPRDIGTILNNAAGQEKDKAAAAEQNENNNKSLSTQAFQSFRDGENLVEVAIALSLRESEATRLYKEFLKLNGWSKLARIHEELKDDIEPFVKLFRLCQIERVGPKDVIKLLEIANNKSGRALSLKGVQQTFESLKNEVKLLEDRRLESKMDLRKLQNQIKALTRVVNSLQLNSNEQQRKVIWLLEEKKALGNLVERFKNNNNFQKISQTVEQKANDLLSDKRPILKLALLCVIESMRNNKDKYNYLMYGRSSISTSVAVGYNSNNNDQLSLYKQGQQQHFSGPQRHDDVAELYKSLLLYEAEKLYDQLLSRLTNSTINEAAFSI
ncbi:MAG TPA: hypothetical protein VE089_08070 [Nitrososphaeraceae archaeon]|jgi:hypothetical protein|nr:hypothetical protein [Nitrososphaeraceae archaeon]